MAVRLGAVVEQQLGKALVTAVGDGAADKKGRQRFSRKREQLP